MLPFDSKRRDPELRTLIAHSPVRESLALLAFFVLLVLHCDWCVCVYRFLTSLALIPAHVFTDIAVAIAMKIPPRARALHGQDR